MSFYWTLLFSNQLTDAKDRNLQRSIDESITQSIQVCNSLSRIVVNWRDAWREGWREMWRESCPEFCPEEHILLGKTTGQTSTGIDFHLISFHRFWEHVI